jgi:poly(3-hydroxybutyrate) depolymerase
MLFASACASSATENDRGGGGGETSQAGTNGSGQQAGAGGPSGSGGLPANGGATGLPGGGVGAGLAGHGGLSGAAGGGAGSTSAGAAGTDGSGSDTKPSAGCGKPRTLQNGTITIPFNNGSRKYVLRAPDDYDNAHPYRLVLAYAASDWPVSRIVDNDYYTFAALDSDNTIFVAPDAPDGMGHWSKGDVDFTDAVLAQLEGELCVDETRIFATGFSFGGGMAIALACTRADVFRGVAFFSGADLTGSCTGPLTKPIAYYASQASQDSSGPPMPSSGRVKQAEFAAVNGCTAEASATTFPASRAPHTCTDYKGCSAGHPTKYCVFDGPHGWEPKDPGQAMSWNAAEAWKFITQF